MLHQYITVYAIILTLPEYSQAFGAWRAVPSAPFRLLRSVGLRPPPSCSSAFSLSRSQSLSSPASFTLLTLPPLPSWLITLCSRTVRSVLRRTGTCAGHADMQDQRTTVQSNLTQPNKEQLPSIYKAYSSIRAGLAMNDAMGRNVTSS
jgi:hypothetical protein